MSGTINDSTVWAPIAGFPAAFVPLTRNGLRLWDFDGPAPGMVLLPPPNDWVIYRRRGGRRVHVLQQVK